MTNERLRTALTNAGMTVVELSERLAVDPKTVERWITTGRPPHRRNRLAVASALDADDCFLWPETADDTRNVTASRSEFTEFFPNRGAVPARIWDDLIDGAAEAIDVLAFGGSFLHDSIADFDARLVARAEAGTSVRLLFGDPESSAVAVRGAEEGLGDLLAARCRLTWAYLQPILGTPGIEARSHGATLYASIFRFDDRILVNHHLFGSPANHNPVHLITRVDGGRTFASYMASFDRVWDSATSV